MPIIYHDYGPDICRQFMDNTQRLICRWLMVDGFSVGISDLMLSKQNDERIKKIIYDIKQEAYKKLEDFRHGNLVNNTIHTNEAFIEEELMNIMNKLNKQVSKICMDGETIDEKTNRMINMVNSGSKGKESNVAQIMGCVAQVKVEGKRIPYGFTGRTLPHYTKFNDGPDARGFVENGFIHGLTPQEVFFHAMGGREGLIDTAVKTSDTGYVQRRLVKSMEDAKVYYDFTVRNAVGNIIQYVYGDDGMNGTKIEQQQVPFVDMNPVQLAHNYLLTEDDELSVYMLKPAVIQTKKHIGLCKDLFEEIVEDRHVLITEIFNNTKIDYIQYPIPFKRIIDRAVTKLQEMNIRKRKSDLDAEYIIKKLNYMKEQYVINQPSLFLRVLLNTYLNPKQIIIHYGFNKAIFDYITQQIETYFKKSFAHPGEMVGIVAAQTIGEMGTQMTLDSFHVSGTDAAVNATSGVPRLKELLSVSKHIKTPTMTIYLKDDIATVYTPLNETPDQTAIEQAKQGALSVKKDLEIIRLSDILDSSQIYWDDGALTNIEDDLNFVSLYNEFKNTPSCTTESNYVLRLVFNKEKMLMYGLRMIDVYIELNKLYSHIIHCIYNDDNADQCIMRVSMLLLNNATNVYGNEDTITMLKAIEHNIVYNMLLKGIHGIRKVSMNKIETIEYKDNEFIRVIRWILNTDGSNLESILSNRNVDATRTRSNDIREIHRVLGIEAARKALALELEDVIGEGKMNHRHMSLLVDTMTCRGYMMSIDRHGINRSDVGPLAKSSFEETTDMLVNASIFSKHDNLNGVSANVMLGQKAPCGTGDCSLHLDEDMYTELMKKVVMEQVIEHNDVIFEENNVNDILIKTTTPVIHENNKCFKRGFKYKLS